MEVVWFHKLKTRKKFCLRVDYSSLTDRVLRYVPRSTSQSYPQQPEDFPWSFRRPMCWFRGKPRRRWKEGQGNPPASHRVTITAGVSLFQGYLLYHPGHQRLPPGMSLSKTLPLYLSGRKPYSYFFLLETFFSNSARKWRLCALTLSHVTMSHHAF